MPRVTLLRACAQSNNTQGMCPLDSIQSRAGQSWQLVFCCLYQTQKNMNLMIRAVKLVSALSQGRCPKTLSTLVSALVVNEHENRGLSHCIRYINFVIDTSTRANFKDNLLLIKYWLQTTPLKLLVSFLCEKTHFHIYRCSSSLPVWSVPSI